VAVLADRDDLIAGFEGELSERQLTFGDRKLIEAEALLMTLIPALEVSDAAQLPNLVRVNANRAITDAVLRVIRNPAGVSYEVIGGITTRFADQASSNLLHFTDEELDAIRTALRPTAPSRRFGVIGSAPPRWFQP